MVKYLKKSILKSDPRGEHMVEIIQIVDKKYRKQFVELPLKMYKGNRYFVPPFYGDEMAMFTKKNIYAK